MHRLYLFIGGHCTLRNKRTMYRQEICWFPCQGQKGDCICSWKTLAVTLFCKTTLILFHQARSKSPRRKGVTGKSNQSTINQQSSLPLWWAVALRLPVLAGQGHLIPTSPVAQARRDQYNCRQRLVCASWCARSRREVSRVLGNDWHWRGLLNA